MKQEAKTKHEEKIPGLISHTGKNKNIFHDLLLKLPENNRLERIWLIAKMDFKRRYYGSFLGLIWAFINPLGLFLIYYFVFTYLMYVEVPKFALFLFLGLIIWIFFAESSVSGLTIIKAKAFILENIQINKLDIYIASLLSNLIGFAFNFTVYFTASLIMGVEIGYQVLYVPLLFINLALFILGVKIVLSVIHIYVNDILHVWNLTNQMLMWFSGIFFVIDRHSEDWKQVVLAYLTPVTGIVKNARAVLIYGSGFDLPWFFYDFAYAIIFLIFAFILLNRNFGVALEKQ